MPDNLTPSIDEQIRDLQDAGWKAMTRTIWRSPLGQLYLGPHGAWKVARAEGLLLSTDRRFNGVRSCDLCAKGETTYVKLPAGFKRLCRQCTALVEDAGLAIKPEQVIAMETKHAQR